MFTRKLFFATALIAVLALTFPPVIPAAAHHDHGQQGHGAHVHGVAELNLVLEGDLLEIEMLSPAANKVGFEHPPRNDEQARAIRQALDLLAAGEEIFGLPPAARCRLVKAETRSDQLPEAEPHGHGHDHAHAHSHSHEHRHDHDHADFHAHWQFQCEQPARLSHLQIRLFEHFPATERIRVQAITPKGQLGAELTPAAARLDL